MYKFSKKSKRVLSTVDERLQRLMERAIEVSPIDFGIPSSGGKRTEEEQHKLFKEGLSKCDGYVKKSYHQSGKAVDVYAYVDGHASWEDHHLALIAGVVLTLATEMCVNINWGGTFGSSSFDGWDKPHFEIVE